MTSAVTHIPGFQQFLKLIARSSLRHPFLTCTLWVVLGVGCVLLALFFLKVDANEDNLISKDLPYNKLYWEYLRTFGDLEFVYGVIEVPPARDPEDQTHRIRAAEAADDFANRLRRLQEEGLVREVVSQIKPPFFEKRFLLHQDPKELRAQLEQLTRSVPGLKLVLESRDLVSLLKGIQKLFGPGWLAPGKDDQSVPESEFERGAVLLQGIFTAIRNAAAGLPLGDPPQILPPFPSRELWLETHLFTQRGSEPGRYDVTKPGLVLVQILPHKDFATLLIIDEPLRRIREALRETRARYPDLRMGLTGRPVIHADEMETTNRDVRKATAMAFPVVALLFFLLFRSIRRPLLALFSLALSIACTYGFVTIAIGRVNLLSVVFILILIGLGVDFGIHILARYMEELQHGFEPRRAALRSVLRAGRGCVAAALTSAVAFFSALWTDFTGLAELGAAAGAGILLCLLAALSFLPAALYLLDRKRAGGGKVRPIVSLPLLTYTVRWSKPLIAISLVLLLVASPLCLLVGLNRNLLELQAEGLESVYYERVLIEQSDMSTWEAVCIVPNAEEARRLAARLSRLPEIRRVETIDTFMVSPEREIENQRILASAYDKLKVIRPVPVSSDIDLKELRTLLNQFTSLTRLVPASAVPPAWRRVISSLGEASKALEQPKVPAPQLRQSLLDYQKKLLIPVRNRFAAYLSALNPPPAGIKDLDPVLRRRFVSEKTGRHLVRAYPAGNAWEYPVLEKFVKSLRSVFPQVTGVAVNFYESVRVMERSFATALAIALSCVTILVFADMQSARYSFFALGTLAAGIIYTLGAMGLIGLEVNLANFFAFPVMVGIGIDSAFHLIHRFRENGSGAPCLSPITAMAVVLSSLTSLVGLGSLMSAAHRGVASLGKLLALGTGMCLVASLILLPAFLCAFGDRTPAPWLRKNEGLDDL